MAIDEKVADESSRLLKQLADDRSLSLVSLIVETDELYEMTAGLFNLTYERNPTNAENGHIYMIATQKVIEKYKNKDDYGYNIR